MDRFAMIAGVLVLMAGCEKKTPRHEGPLRVALGDCASDTVWVSGPRPEDPAKRVAKQDKPDEPKIDDNGDPELSRQQAIDQAREAGIIGGTENGAFASLTGTGDISSGFDDTNIYGGLLGNDDTMTGGFGYGRSGFGPGGGGTGWGTIGTGRYGTIGRGSGTGSGYGVGGRGGMRGRSAAVPTVSIGQPNAQGDLDKAIIRRYIKRNIQKIQYCYEKALLAKPKLAGTVQTQFFIKPDGTVANATASGVDPDVSNCLASVIKMIEFPKPKGGGGVQVNYPFTFRPADGSIASTPTPPAPPMPPDVKQDEPPKPTGTAAGAGKPADVPGRYVTGGNNPLLAQKDVLEECFRTHSKPYGVVTVKLDWTGNAVTAAAVQGVDEGVAKCVAEAAQKVTRSKGEEKSQTCSVAFGDMPVVDLPSIEITNEAIKLDGTPVVTTQAVAADSKLFKIDALFEKLEARVKRDAEVTQPVSIIGPLVIRPLDLTPIAIVNKVLATTSVAGGNFVLAASEGPSWRLLHELAVPVVPVPRGTGGRWGFAKSRGSHLTDTDHVTLSLLIQKDQIWVGLSRVNEFQQIPMRASGELDWDKLEATLKQHKVSAFFVDRTDLEIAGENVTWIDIVHAIDIAKKVGFIDFAVFDPASLSARPQL
jgi:hypothetical protein